MAPTILSLALLLLCWLPASLAGICEPLIGRVQESELDAANTVVMHDPLLEVVLGSLHPAASMYWQPTSILDVQTAHRRFAEQLKDRGIRYLLVKDVLIECTAQQALLDLAMDSVQYVVQGDVSGLSGEEQAMATDAYKRQSLAVKSSAELFDIILMQPTVTIEPAQHSRNSSWRVVQTAVDPLTKLVFTRDQQLITAKGLVVANMMFENRRRETKVMRRVWASIGVTPIGVLEGDERAEGGDFLAHSLDLAFIGVGLRTTWQAVRRMLDRDWFGTQRVAVVLDENDRHHSRMHLDTVFNLVTRDVALVLEDLFDEAQPELHRTVVEFVKNERDAYEERPPVPLQEWLEANGFRVVTVTREQQLRYMINFVHLGPDEKDDAQRPVILTSHPDLLSVLQRADIPNAAVIVQHVEYDAITALYGAAHCTTAVFRLTDGQRKASAYRPNPYLKTELKTEL